MSRPDLDHAGVRDAAAAQWAVRLADGPLGSEDTIALQAWLDADPSNAAAMEAIVESWRAVEAYAGAPELLSLRQQALQSAERAHRSHAPRGVRPRWMAAAAAACLVLVAGGGWAWLSPRAYATGLGERRVVALADGSRMSLDGETRVRVRYALGRRSLWLDRGRAKFEVAKDPLRPFTVRSRGEEVVATGTAFSVEVIGRQVRVVLYEGHVAVLHTSRGVRQTLGVGREQAPADKVLTPGHELIAAPGPGPKLAAVLVRVDPVRSLAWEGGQLVFEDEPLSTAVARINRSAATPLAIGDAATGQVRISGVFQAGDTGHFVQGLTAAFPVRAEAEADRIVLSQDRARTVRGR